jgi:hypothetical protein
MRIMIAAAVAAMTLCLSSPDVFGQGVEMRSPTSGEFEIKKDPDSNQRPSPSAGSVSRPLRRGARVLTKGPLAPSAQDRANYASFLSQPKTGLIRLLPRTFKQSKFSNPDRSVRMNGGGAYYSFFYRTHEYGFGSDLELSTVSRFYGTTELPPTHHLSVGFAGADYGMMTILGDLLLETLTVDDPRVQFMFGYKPSRLEPEARKEKRLFHEGISIDGQTYQSRLPIQVNTTYLLRSIDYEVSDVLVAFRIVREDTDKSLIIAWKLLKGFPTPRLNKSK